MASPARSARLAAAGLPRGLPGVLEFACTAVRLPSGYSLIADSDGNRAVETDPSFIVVLVYGDGSPEMLSRPRRNPCRLYACRKASPCGSSWYRHTLDDRFEHHDGTKVVELRPGVPAIISHGWKDSIYVHLWERDA